MKRNKNQENYDQHVPMDKDGRIVTMVISRQCT